MSKANKTNKLMDFLNVELPDIKKSYCNLTRANRFTASVGYIYPTLVEEILPSDRVKMNIKTILKSNPTVNSVYGSMRQSHQAFFVPLRFYVRDLDQNFTFYNNDFDPVRPESYPDFPVINIREIAENYTENYFCAPGSLLDMLEIFPAGFNLRASYDSSSGNGIPNLNAIPLLAYYDIVRNYYFNSQELDMPFVQMEYFTPYDISDGEETYVTKVYAVTHFRNKSFFDTLIEIAYDGVFSNGDINLLHYLQTSSVPLLSQAPFSGIDRDLAPASGQSCDVHLGYAVRCFDDDYFTTALSNQYVSALDNSVRVNVNSVPGQGASFAVTQLQRARQMARHVSRNILGGTNYDDYIYVHFNTKLGRELNKPYFLGSASSDFWFDDIYASTVGEDQSLGSRAGVLDNSMTYNDFVDFTASEYGYLIVMSSIIPRISYYAGIPKKYLKTNMADLYSPEFDAWGFQGIPQIEVSAIADTPWTFGSGGEYGEPLTKETVIDFDPSTQGLSVVRKQPAWFEHMASYDRFHGLFTTDMEHSFSIIAKDYSPRGTSGGTHQLMSTYIHPWEFQYLFKYQPSWYDNFTWQILFDLNVYRPISKQILPSY